MSKTFPHAILRSGWYHYHRRVPKEVIERKEAYGLYFRGRPFFRRSLKTKKYAEALGRAGEAEHEYDALVAMALGRKAPAAPTPVARPLDAAALGEVSSYVCSSIVRRWRGDILRAGVDEEAADYLHWRIENFSARREDADLATALLVGQSAKDKASSINREWGFSVDEKSVAFAELYGAVTDGCAAAHRAVQELFAGNSLPTEPTSTLIKNFAATPTTAYSKRFSEVVAEHIRASDFATKTIAKARRSHRLFLDVVGDKAVGEITKADVHSFLDALAVQEVGKTAGRKISRETARSYLTQITSPLNFAIGRGWLAEPNPAAGIKVSHWVAATDPQQQPKRRRFEIAELNALFQHPWFKGCASPTSCYEPGEFLLDDMRYWAPVVALYTGARAGELAGMKLDEVFIDDSSPHLAIRCNNYRNTKSRLDRHAPVVDALFDLGFCEYVERVRATGSDRLFPDWKFPSSGGAQTKLSNWANTKWIRAFNRTVLGSVFPHLTVDGQRSPLEFHSLRGAFKVLLLNSGPRHLANAVIGHLQDELDKAYVGLVSPAETYAAFRHVDFPTLHLPGRAALATHPNQLVA